MNDKPMQESHATILIVDDKPDNLRLLSAMLADEGYEVRRAINGSTALMGVQASPPDLILLDIGMPGMNGYEVCERLKSDEKTCEIPVIFVSALGEAIDKVRAFEVGGVDYITKPIELTEVLARIENHLSLQAAKAEIHQLNRNLEQRVIRRTVQLEAEMKKRQQIQEQLLHVALHDELTGLPNRAWFMQRLNQALDRTRRDSNYHFAVMFLDCDRFKVINDSLGHLVGDQLLVAVAHRIEACLPPGGTLARLGGDEFTILLENINSIDEATAVAQHCHRELTLPLAMENHELYINVSIGIVLGNAEYEEPEHLLRDADTAMYQAKAQGKAQYQLFDTEMHQRALRLLQLETDLRLAIDRQELTLYYQPIICLDTGRIVGLEALLRWRHPQHGFVSPGELIPVAEDTGLIIPIGLWVLRKACQQIRAWQRTAISMGSKALGGGFEGLANLSGEEDRVAVFPLKMNVNLSVKQFCDPDLLDGIDQTLQETGLDSQYLNLEITESAIIDNAASASTILAQLKSRRIQLALDDFGTGYSSLSYLRRYPVDTLKIDRSFTSMLDETGRDREIIQATIHLAHSLGLNVVAEGIETEQQLRQLRALGCDFGQGYFFAPPLDAEATEALLVDNLQEKSPSHWNFHEWER